MCTMCSKLLLFVINVTFFICGAFLAVLGGLAKFNQDLLLKAFSVLPSEVVDDIAKGWDIPAFLDSAGLAMLIAGCLIFFIGFCGCCGGLRESKCLLVTYMICVGVIFCGQVAAAVLIYVKTDEFEDATKKILTDSINDEYTDEVDGLQIGDTGIPQIATNAMKLAWDSTQILMGCCGVNNYSDYSSFSGTYKLINGSATVDVTNAIVPLSCCNYISEAEYMLVRDKDFFSNATGDVDGAEQCLLSAAASHTRTKGCYGTLYDFLDEYQLIMIGILAAIVAIEIVGFISACCVIKAVDKGVNIS